MMHAILKVLVSCSLILHISTTTSNNASKRVYMPSDVMDCLLPYLDRYRLDKLRAAQHRSHQKLLTQKYMTDYVSLQWNTFKIFIANMHTAGGILLQLFKQQVRDLFVWIDENQCRQQMSYRILFEILNNRKLTSPDARSSIAIWIELFFFGDIRSSNINWSRRKKNWYKKIELLVPLVDIGNLVNDHNSSKWKQMLPKLERILTFAVGNDVLTEFAMRCVEIITRSIRFRRPIVLWKIVNVEFIQNFIDEKIAMDWESIWCVLSKLTHHLFLNEFDLSGTYFQLLESNKELLLNGSGGAESRASIISTLLHSSFTSPFYCPMKMYQIMKMLIDIHWVTNSSVIMMLSDHNVYDPNCAHQSKKLLSMFIDDNNNKTQQPSYKQLSINHTYQNQTKEENFKQISDIDFKCIYRNISNRSFPTIVHFKKFRQSKKKQTTQTEQFPHKTFRAWDDSKTASSKGCCAIC